jgi:hypothetical protein
MLKDWKLLKYMHTEIYFSQNNIMFNDITRKKGISITKLDNFYYYNMIRGIFFKTS